MLHCRIMLELSALNVCEGIRKYIFDTNLKHWLKMRNVGFFAVFNCPSVFKSRLLQRTLKFSWLVKRLINLKTIADFKERLEDEAKKLDLPMDDVSTKYFILLPSSCNIKDFLQSGRDHSGIEICHKGVIQIATETHAGKPRTFKLPMYSVSKGNEVILLLFECLVVPIYSNVFVY